METSQLVQQMISTSIAQQYKIISWLPFFFYVVVREVLLVTFLALHRCCNAKGFDAKERHALVAIHSVIGIAFYLYAGYLWSGGIYYANTGALLYSGSMALSWCEWTSRSCHLFPLITSETKQGS